MNLTADDEIMVDPESARRARQTFKAIFENQLDSGESEAFLLQEEEEDVMGIFITWVQEMKLSIDTCTRNLTIWLSVSID